MQIIHAEQDLVDIYEKELMEVLNIIDQTEAFVTDYTDILDLIPFEILNNKISRNKNLIEYYIKEIKSLFKENIEINPSDKICFIAQKLYLSRQNKSIH